MNDNYNKLEAESVANIQEAAGVMQRLLDVARPDKVYSEPVTNGDYTVITASELAVGIGFGFGGGGGTAPAPTGETAETAATDQTPSGYGSGGGGGGTTLARPVVVIEIGPQGVRVEPIVDPTKIAIAFLTTMAAIVATLARAWRKR